MGGSVAKILLDTYIIVLYLSICINIDTLLLCHTLLHCKIVLIKRDYNQNDPTRKGRV